MDRKVSAMAPQEINRSTDYTKAQEMSTNLQPHNETELVRGIVEETDPDERLRHQHHHKRHHKRHYHRMRMHDHNVRKLIECDCDFTQSCICDVTPDQSSALDSFGAWGAVSIGYKVPQTKTSKKTSKTKGTGRTYGSAGSQKGYFTRDRDVLQEEDCYRFQHYDDTSLYMRQYREEHTICIQGEDPCGPPVLGKDTPDPYFAKLSQCGDLWDRLMAFTTYARERLDDDPHSPRSHSPLEAWPDNSGSKAQSTLPRLPEEKLAKNKKRTDTMKELVEKYKKSHEGAFLRVMNSAKSTHSALSLSTDLHIRGQVPRKAINLTPVRDCRVAVKTINFPHAAPPKRQPNHIPQLQQQLQITSTSTSTPSLPDIGSTRMALPLPVKIVVNSESLKGNKLNTSSPPHTPSKSPQRPLVRSESVGTLQAQYRISKQAMSKKRSEGDIRQTLCSTATATDFTITDPNIYQQFLAQQRKLGKASSTGHLYFAANSSQSGRRDSGGKVEKKGSGGGRGDRATLGLCERYSSSGTMLTAANKG